MATKFTDSVIFNTPRPNSDKEKFIFKRASFKIACRNSAQGDTIFFEAFRITSAKQSLTVKPLLRRTDDATAKKIAKQDGKIFKQDEFFLRQSAGLIASQSLDLCLFAAHPH